MTTLPAKSTATQNVVLTQDTAFKELFPSTWAGCDHAGVALAGLVEVVTPPPPSTATHRLVPTHETPSKLFRACVVCTVHEPAPPVGLVDVTTSALMSTPAQKVLVGHETPLIKLPLYGGWWSI